MIYSLPEPESAEPWDTVIEHLKHSEAGTVSLSYTLQVVATDDNDFEIEYNGPLLALI